MSLVPLCDSAQGFLLLDGKVVNFRCAGVVDSTLLYYDNQGTFASLVVSRNPYGESVVGALWLGLAMMVLLTVVLLWFISRLWASRMVNGIDADY
ncbi:MAG: hypothetical protein IJV22_04760 [Bacteroidales bacterium]|nr:hypothetical protein [Bacteroidales bacterium]